MRYASIVSAVVLAVACLGGCEGPAFIAKTMTGGDKIKAQYKLADRPTLVMVDDPNQVLASPILSGVIASHVAFHLKENGAVTTPFVSQKKLADARDRLGKRFATTPVDEIGRMTGAEQVIFINLESAVLQPAPSFYRPTAMVELKLVDAKEGKRLFPEPPPIIQPGEPSRGKMMEIAFRYKGLEAESAGQDAMLARMLAERIGRDVARVFYEHKPDDPFAENR